MLLEESGPSGGRGAFWKRLPFPRAPIPAKTFVLVSARDLRAVSLPSATVPGGAAAPVRRPYPGIPERMGSLAWLHCRSCCDEILMLAGIVLRAWVLPEGEGVLWNLSLGQGSQLMRGLVCRRRAGQRHAVLLEEMRGGDGARCAEGGRRIRTGRESTFAGGLYSSLAGLEGRMPGKGMPGRIEKNFLQMSRLGTCWQCFLKIPATGLYAR